MNLLSQLRLQTAFTKQMVNREIWNGDEHFFGSDVYSLSGGRIKINIDKTIMDQANEIENLEDIIRRLDTEIKTFKGLLSTGSGKENFVRNKIYTFCNPFVDILRLEKEEDRGLTIDRTLQEQTSKISHLIELVKRSIKDLNALKETHITRKYESCFMGSFSLCKANHEIGAKILNEENKREEHQEETENLRQLVKRLTSERNIQQDEIKAGEERYKIIRTQEKKMKMDAVDFKNEILRCKQQINELTIKSSRYQTKYKETRMQMKSIENEKRLLDSQFKDKTEELARMKQTVKELKAHEEMSIRLSKEKTKLEKEKINVEKMLKQMTSKIQNTSKSIDENKSLRNSIKSLRGQIKDKDEQIQKCELEYENLQDDLTTHQYTNRKILKYANRSEQMFKKKRTVSDRDGCNVDLPCAEINENVLGKRAKRMRNVNNSLNVLKEKDQISSQESCSESSDDCSVLGKGELQKMSNNGMVLSNKNKQKSLTLRKDSKKEVNIFNITNCAKFTFKSDITHHSNDILSDISSNHAIDEDNE